MFDKTKTDLLKDTGTVSFAPWREISFSLVGYDYKKELSQLNVPTLFIHGAAKLNTGKPVADELCTTCPQLPTAESTQSGHWAFLEEPDENFSKWTERFPQPIITNHQLPISTCN
ncbi:MAG: alpha/beta hydrolase [Anaerolineales bacterium]|nr:alpha/beta hydrolase [Anaerolineales bacterium]